MDTTESVTDALLALPPSQLCQAFFLLSAILVLSLSILPKNTRKILFDYGARRPKEGSNKADKNAASKTSATGLNGVLASLTSYGQVPHSWFLHFYVVSVSWSAFWAWQYLRRDSIMGALARMEDRTGEPSMEISNVFVAWSLMGLQGSRRLYESLYVSKPGSSPMWFIHWAVGLAFYTVMGTSVWIEGSSAILMSWESSQPPSLTLRTVSGLLLYFVAWLEQNDCHQYLATLKKYTLPTQGWFKYMVCPHYTCECLIYLAIAFVAAPQGYHFNRSVLCGLLFVVVNLGSTAHGTKQWYADKFGAEKVAARWKMIPFIF